MKRKSSVSKKDVRSAECASDKDRLEQANICREQAREAARRKRFTAACGLFSTACALYQQAIAMDGGAHNEAEEHLSQLQSEMAAYSELAKSMERPLLMRPVHAASIPDARRQIGSAFRLVPEH